MNKLRDLVRTDAARDRFLPTVKKALPYRIDPVGAKEAVLLLHGLTGNPSELSHLAKALSEAGYAVSAPRHPGHGTGRADILKSGATDWLRSSFDAYLDLLADYKTVHVIGHSMGGLLATSVAMTFNVPKLILLAPAYVLGAKHVRWVIFISRFIKVIVRNKPISESDSTSADQRQLHAEYWTDELLSPVAELLKLSMLCRRNLVRLRSKILVVVGDKDVVVLPGVAPLIARLAVNAASVDTSVIQGAGHIFPFDDHAEETTRLVIDWISPPAN